MIAIDWNAVRITTTVTKSQMNGADAQGGKHPDIALEFEQFLEARLLIELHQLVAILGPRRRDHGIEDPFERTLAGLGLLERLVELALAQWLNQRRRGARGPGAQPAQGPQPFKDDRDTQDRDGDKRVSRVVPLLNHRDNAILLLHC
jgi:hypothetical protein